MVKKIWNILGDIRISFVLLLAASATLFTGSIYAGNHFSLFREMNRLRVQDWLAVHWASHPELVWWIPLLFVIMGVLGLNTFICATNRVARLISQRATLAPWHFFYLLIPSLVHFLFIFIMIGHLTTFLTATWQTQPIDVGTQVTLEGGRKIFSVAALEDRFFPETSGLRHRIAQTSVRLVSEGKEITLQYLNPVRLDGRFLFLDKIKERQKFKAEMMPPSTDDETCNKAPVYKKEQKARQLLLIVSDPGLCLIVTGLTLVMCLMTLYFLVQGRKTSL